MELLRVIESGKGRIEFITFHSIDIVVVLDAARVFLSARCLRQFSLGVFAGDLMTSKDVAILEGLQARGKTDARITHHLQREETRSVLSFCLCL